MGATQAAQHLLWTDQLLHGCGGRDHHPRGKVQGCRNSLSAFTLSGHRAHRPREHTLDYPGPAGLVIKGLSRREVQSGPLSPSLVASATPHRLCRNPGQSETCLKEENYPESVSRRKLSSEKVCPCYRALSLSPPAKLKAYPIPPGDF